MSVLAGLPYERGLRYPNEVFRRRDWYSGRGTRLRDVFSLTVTCPRRCDS